jgi:hypothetical protein
MREFFNRADVKALQGIQKRSPASSQDHNKATLKLATLAARIGAADYFKNE